MQKYCFFSLNAIVYKKLTRYFGSMAPGRGCLAGWQRHVAACRMGLKGGRKRRRRGSGSARQAMAATLIFVNMDACILPTCNRVLAGARPQGVNRELAGCNFCRQHQTIQPTSAASDNSLQLTNHSFQSLQTHSIWQNADIHFFVKIIHDAASEAQRPGPQRIGKWAVTDCETGRIARPNGLYGGLKQADWQARGEAAGLRRRPCKAFSNHGAHA